MHVAVLLFLLFCSVDAVTKIRQKRTTEEERSTQEGEQQLFKSSSLPSATMSMNDLVPLLHALEIGLPFSFAHFNDGEITALHCREGRSTSKKKQPCSAALQNAMRQVFYTFYPSLLYLILSCPKLSYPYLTCLQSLVDRADNFYVGAICPCSFTISQHVQVNITKPVSITSHICIISSIGLTFD